MTVLNREISGAIIAAGTSSGVQIATNSASNFLKNILVKLGQRTAGIIPNLDNVGPNFSFNRLSAAAVPGKLAAVGGKPA